MQRSISVIIGFLVSLHLFSQDEIIAGIEVSAGAYLRYNTPLSADLSPLSIPLNDSTLSLYELTEAGRVSVNFQLEHGSHPRLWWILDGITEAGQTRTYQLQYGSINYENQLQALITDSDLNIIKSGSKVLSYRHAINYPPEGVALIYKRSGYIHPLLSPGGNILTRINPPDHYHHYGIWNPWAKTHFREQEIDFWNLNLGQGTVRFGAFISTSSGKVFGGFKALQEHIAFNIPGENKIVMNEVLDTRVYNIDSCYGKSAYMVDYTSVISCATNDEVILDAYRYGGGIGFRATEEWTNTNSRVLTSEGKTREEADASFGRWVDVSGNYQNGTRSGIIFMSSPTNRRHPESMRVWPVDSNNGRGDMYFEFCPARHEPWVLKPGNEYSQRYRLFIYDGTIDKETAESLWTDFACPPDITIIKQ